MDKNQIISFIKTQISTGAITQQELIEIATGTTSTKSTVPSTAEASNKLIHIFYAIGAIIALVGVVILIAQHWHDIGVAGRVLVTLGIALVTYIAALVQRDEQHRKLSEALFLISAVLAPLGAFVLIEEANITMSVTVNITTAIILTVIYAVAWFVSKKNIPAIATIAFATWAYYAIVFEIFDVNRNLEDVLQAATIVLGIAYILIGLGYKQMEGIQDSHIISRFLNGLGTLAILGTGITIGGAFDMFYILILFAAFYASVYLRSTSMLLLAALFLIAHIIKLTGEHFMGSVGWPVALIVGGFVVIGIGYFTFFLNKKYIKQ